MLKKITVTLTITAILLSSSVAYATDFTNNGFIVRDPILSGGGGNGTVSTFDQTGSVGQEVAPAEISNSSFTVKSGFLAFAATTLTQYNFRWYDNDASSIQPSSSKGGENANITAVSSGNLLRLRMNLVAPGEPYKSGETFKLQFGDKTGSASCAAVTSWTDVAASGDVSTAWIGFDNTALSEGTLSAPLLTGSVAAGLQTYEEFNSSTATPVVIASGPAFASEWDWAVKFQGSNIGKTFCFRMVKGDGTALDTYTNYPEATTVLTGGSGGGSSGGSGGGSSGGSAVPAVTPVVEDEEDVSTPEEEVTEGESDGSSSGEDTASENPAIAAYEQEQATVKEEGIVTTDFIEPATKCEFLVMNGKAAGWNVDLTQTVSEYFNDINDMGVTWCAPYADYGFKTGTIKGRSQGVFGVEGTITRYEVATIIARQLTNELESAFGLEDFIDRDQILEVTWAAPAVAYLKIQNIFKGFDLLDGTFKFGGELDILKIDAAIVLYRTFIQ